MTNQEISWWLRRNPTREFKYKAIYGNGVYHDYNYLEENADVPVGEDFLIRENGGEWHEPLVEVSEE